MIGGNGMTVAKEDQKPKARPEQNIAPAVFIHGAPPSPGAAIQQWSNGRDIFSTVGSKFVAAAGDGRAPTGNMQLKLDGVTVCFDRHWTLPG